MEIDPVTGLPRSTYAFTVTNTQPLGGVGIKGLVVYSPVAPVGMSTPDRCKTALYQAQNQYSWWDFNGGPDVTPVDGLPDRFIAPQQSRGGTTFTLTYVGEVPSTFIFALHIVEPFTGETWFVHANPQPAAVIRGSVACGEEPVAQALVELLSGSQVVAQTPTDVTGGFQFANVPSGQYQVRVSAADFHPFTSNQFSFSAQGADLGLGTLQLTPLPVCYQAAESLQGRVFFARGKTAFRDKEAGVLYGPATPNQNLDDANLGQLTDAGFISPVSGGQFTKSYKYFGYVPGFPELGLFDHSTPEKSLWVIMETPLAPGNVWQNGVGPSFRNMVYVTDAIANPNLPRPPSGSYTIRILFSHPFGSTTEPCGTAYQYQITGLDFGGTQGIISASDVCHRLPSVPWYAPAAPAPSLLSTVPPGWMAQTRCQFRQEAGLPFTLWIVGSYRDVCGHQFYFRIHPEGDDSPDPDM